MKRLALAACFALAAASGARADGGVLATAAASTIGVKAAANLVSVPYAGLGVFASRWDSQDYGTLTGYGVRLGWNVVEHLGLEARASYYEAKDDEFETTLLPLEAVLVLRLPLHRHFVPYVGAGAGYYFKDAEYEDDTETWESSEEVAGYFGLAGLNLYLGGVSLFAEAKYNLVGTDDDLEWRGSDVEAQNSLDGFSFSAGLKLGF
ncbi:MAG: outer membrane beta-barrel protein [Kiritimatiellia bacterium]